MFEKMKTVYFTLLYCVLGLSLAANYGFYSGSVAMGGVTALTVPAPANDYLSELSASAKTPLPGASKKGKK